MRKTFGASGRGAMVTIKDISREVGLSVTTVSRALNNHDDVADKTRALVHEIARKLDYHPNAAARSLQNSRANAIGLVIPPILHRAYDTFWLEFIGGMTTSCARFGTDLLLSAADAGKDEGHDFKRLVRGRRVDGLLICDIRKADPRIAYLREHKLPFVAFGRTMDRHDYSYIDVDGEAGAFGAVDYLIRLGHQRIAYLGVASDYSFSHFRLSGYRGALARAGLPYNPQLVHESLTDGAASTVLARLLDLPQRPTAIFASADFLALGAIKAARALGLSVPRDLSVVVFDDNALVQQADPPLTAVTQPNRRLGEEAAALLLDRVKEPGLPLVQRLVVPSLSTRLSTAPPFTQSEIIAVAQ
ncbi:MAG TPA: LacI family DNA-binding transcriptional regulator [Chloroflexota bacterium]